MLSDEERRTLAELAAGIDRSDPKLGRTLTNPLSAGRRWWWAMTVALLVAVALILIIAAAATGQWVPALIGAAIMVMLAVAEVARRLVRRRRLPTR